MAENQNTGGAGNAHPAAPAPGAPAHTGVAQGGIVMGPNGPTTLEEMQRAQREGQEKLAKRVKNWSPEVSSDEDARVSINSKLTTKEHVGNHPDEPNKSDEDERAKGGTLKRREFKVETAPVKSADGTVIDHVVTSPAAVAPAPHPELHKHDAIGTAKVVADATGDKSGKSKDEKPNEPTA